MYAGDEEVFVAVVVVIADRHANVIAGPGQSGFLGHVGEGSVAIVPKQPIGVLRRSFFKVGNVRAVGKKNIQVPVVVIVKYGNAPGHGLGGMFLECFRIVQQKWDRTELKVNARLG